MSYKSGKASLVVKKDQKTGQVDVPLVPTENPHATSKVYVDTEIAAAVTGSSSDTQVIYNSSGTLTGDAGFTYAETANVVQVGTGHTITSATNGIVSGTTNTIGAANAGAHGTGTVASGAQSFAIGDGTDATGDNSLATGEDSLASGDRSFAGGSASTASGADSFAFGSGADATAANTVALGTNATAAASGAIVLGEGTLTGSSANSVLIAASNDAADIFSSSASPQRIFLFARNGASYDDAIVLFAGDNASRRTCSVRSFNNQLVWTYPPSTGTDWSTFHYGTTVPSNYGVALDRLADELNTLEGTGNTASGTNAVAFGAGCTASATNSFAGGDGCTAAGLRSFCWGDGCQTGTVASSGVSAFCAGINSIANGPGSIALGNTATVASGGNSSVGIGLNANVSSDNSIVLGEGTLSGSSDYSILIAASNDNANKITFNSSPQRVILYARNNGAFDDGIMLWAGDATIGRKSMGIREHDSVLAWSYTPVTSADWTGLPSGPSAPGNVGAALDTLASELITSYIITTFSDTSTWTGAWTTGQSVTTNATRISNVVTIVVQSVTSTTNTGDLIRSGAALLPAAFRPTQSIATVHPVTSNSTNAFGTFAISAAGQLLFSAGPGTGITANFAASGLAGWTLDARISYVV